MTHTQASVHHAQNVQLVRYTLDVSGRTVHVIKMVVVAHDGHENRHEAEFIVFTGTDKLPIEEINE